MKLSDMDESLDCKDGGKCLLKLIGKWNINSCEECDKESVEK